MTKAARNPMARVRLGRNQISGRNLKPSQLLRRRNQSFLEEERLGPQVGQSRGEERDKQVYTTHVHKLDTKLTCPVYEIKHETVVRFQVRKFGHFLVMLCRFLIKPSIHWKYCRQNIGSKCFLCEL
jgi:hypothetical protein